ncbi:unnamed protein product [Symbiodinium necroappetens]|uniref:Uncharacterized protein n=1 Tax=Symbiodinium necroappetens TaxID=1628268 RepID=A0A812NWV9_9DINO|nr:unnamed protein product [Symbiodinium necroappetens]
MSCIQSAVTELSDSGSDQEPAVAKTSQPQPASKVVIKKPVDSSKPQPKATPTQKKKPAAAVKPTSKAAGKKQEHAPKPSKTESKTVETRTAEGEHVEHPKTDENSSGSKVTPETENSSSSKKTPKRKMETNEAQKGFKLRPYTGTHAMAIQHTTGEKKQVLQVKVKGASIQQNTEVAEVLLKLLRDGHPVQEVMSMKEQLCSELKEKLQGAS